MGGAAFAADQSSWKPIAAEKTATGYQVVWKLAGTDQYTVWNTDSNGNYTSNAIGIVSGASSALKSFETSFQQDLNRDGAIGIPPIEAFGSTSLVQVGNNYVLNGSSGPGPVLKYGGAAFAADQSSWTPIAAEKTATGYQVVWKLAGTDQYTVWNTDSNGNYTSNAIGIVSGASSALKSFETSFQQDLNRDGVTGIPPIEAFGSTSLSSGRQ